MIAPLFAPEPRASLDDRAAADRFGDRLVRALNESALVLMVSVGHRAGLFDAMDGAGPLTSAQVAGRALLDERYVREWLGAMTTAGVVVHEPGAGTFELPRAHAAKLTRAAAPDNLAALAQYVPLLGSVEDRIVTCFRRGGGVPYAAFPRFHEVMAEDSGQTVLPVLFDRILPLAPGLTDALRAGIDVLDVGCGSGRALNLMARRFPNSRFVGADFSPQAIAAASDEAARHGTPNVRFEVRDVAALGAWSEFDLVTAFDAIHDQADPEAVLAGIAAALRPDGVFLMQDIRASSRVHENADHPLGTFLYTISCMHCMTVSLAAGGAGLGTCWGVDTARRMLADAGFGDVAVHELEHDLQNAYFVCRLANS